MHEFKIDGATKNGRLMLEGQLRIQNAATIKEAVMSALSETDNLSINHGNAKSFDLSYLQILVSAHKTAVSQNKQLQVEEEHPVEFYTLLKDSACPAYSWLNIENDAVNI